MGRAMKSKVKDRLGKGSMKKLMAMHKENTLKEMKDGLTHASAGERFLKQNTTVKKSIVKKEKKIKAGYAAAQARKKQGKK